MAQAGIYAIRNTTNGKVYVGQSVDIKRRWRRHKYELRHGCHPSSHLQRAWLVCGEPHFVFEVLEAVADVAGLDTAEQRHIDAAQSANPSCGYNLSPTAGSQRGMKRTPETRRRLAEAHRRLNGTQRYSAFGRSAYLRDWADEYGINPATLSNRLHRAGYSMEAALTLSRFSGRRSAEAIAKRSGREVLHTAFGVTDYLTSLARHFGVKKNAVWNYVGRSKLNAEQAITLAKKRGHTA